MKPEGQKELSGLPATEWGAAVISQIVLQIRPSLKQLTMMTLRCADSPHTWVVAANPLQRGPLS